MSSENGSEVASVNVDEGPSVAPFAYMLRYCSNINTVVGIGTIVNVSVIMKRIV